MEGSDWLYGEGDINDEGGLLLYFCCNNALCIMNIIMNTFFQERDLQKSTQCRYLLDQQSLIDFCILSADFFQSVLDIRVKRVQNC